MKNTLFVDTGAFYARYVSSDQYHDQSLVLWEKIRDERWHCTTSNLVVVELLNLILRHFGQKEGLKVASEIYHSQVIRIQNVTLALELKALEWIRKYPDQDFSMTDATSFACMENQKIKKAFTFDHHFNVAGFQRF